MIADFRFSASPSPFDVVVELYWQDGVRMGRIAAPDFVDAARSEQELPMGDSFPLVTAIAYAMVLACTAECPLRLAGDRSAWPASWGKLLETH